MGGGTDDSEEGEVGPQKFTTYPTENSGALRNPMKGFRPTTYRNNYNDEYATITRSYLKWNELENNVNDTIQKIKDVCDQSGQMWSNTVSKLSRVLFGLGRGT